jgi:ABC-type phosphate transport system substrate-binding protein
LREQIPARLPYFVDIAYRFNRVFASSSIERKAFSVKKMVRAGLATTAATALVMGLATAPNASADYAPIAQDVVGVGGDTPQYDLQFLADGSSIAGTQGYNSTGNRYKLVTFNATPDGNARAAYANGSTQSSPIPLNATDVLREGTSPVQRVQSSGAAITALLADTGTPETINFVFSASLPTTAQQTQAGNQGWGSLHVVQLGTDAVQIVADATSHAPAGLSTAELLAIYKGDVTKWNQINSSLPNATIIPLLPPSSSSITKTFLADLKTANGGTAPTLANPNIKTVEQNDPTAITAASSPADAIVPFSSARLKLYDNHYFRDPSTVFPGSSSPIDPGVDALTGSSPDSGSAYSSTVKHYVIFRQSDLSSATPWQPGSSKNWVQTLFSGGTPFAKSTAGLADIAAAGTTPAYSDLGNVSSG